ncbi:MAG: MarR family transcriptional regulator [Alphaproteobacteria bacterium]|nr:MarR family transcriptional regulator [Alphaproteobacteria bacterium]
MSTQLKALELWRHSLVASVRGDAPDLSARQMALLLSVYMEGGPHTVRGLAKALKISKPAISRALDRLGELNYVRRERDELDRRNVLVQRTGTGAVFLKGFAALIVEANAIVESMPMREIDFGVEAETASTPSAGASEAVWAEAAA